MKRKMKNAIAGALAAICIIAGAAALLITRDYRAADNINDKAQNLSSSVNIPDIPVPLVPKPTDDGAPPLDSSAHFLLDLNLAPLRDVNEDVLAWIYIPDTAVNYPLMRGADNGEYLNRAWDGTQNRAGSIFLECKNSAELSDFNTIIYGHNMKNGSMFAALKAYSSESYFSAHPYVYIVTDDAVMRYRVFSAYEASVVSDTYRLYFENDERRQSAIDHYVQSSAVKVDIAPATHDRVLTLSTCVGNGTYDTRWVVQAVLDGEFIRK